MLHKTCSLPNKIPLQNKEMKIWGSFKKNSAASDSNFSLQGIYCIERSLPVTKTACLRVLTAAMFKPGEAGGNLPKDFQGLVQ